VEIRRLIEVQTIQWQRKWK